MAPGDEERGSDGEDLDRSVGWEDPGEADGDGDPRTRANETADPGEADDDGWRFDLDEVDEDGIVTTDIEPEELDAENVAFVLLGAIAMVLVFVRLSMLLG